MINGESLAAHHTNAATRTGQAEHAEPDVQRISARLRRLSDIMVAFQAARAMRMTQGAHPLLLMALTGWGHGEDRRRSQEAGFDHHLVKPVAPRAIHELLVNNTRLAPTPQTH